MNSPRVSEAMIEQAETLFVRRKTKLLGIAMEEEKEQRRQELELEQRVLNLYNEDQNDFLFDNFQQVGFDKTPLEEMDLLPSSVSKSTRKSRSKLSGRRKNSKGKNKSVINGDRGYDNDIIYDNHINKMSDNNGKSCSSSVTEDKGNVNKEVETKPEERLYVPLNVEINEEQWIMPTTCDKGKLSEAQIKSWQEQGYAVVQDLLPTELLQGVLKDAECTFPDPSSDAARKITDFGDGLAFPSTFDSVNEIVLHPQLLEAVATLLKVSIRDIRLTQAEVWPKYGFYSNDAFNNSDQRIHCDFPNHTLVCPPTWDEPEAVEMIIYLNDVEQCGGATAVVPRTGSDDPAYEYPMTGMPGFGALQWRNNREKAEEYIKDEDKNMYKFRKQHLYPREKYAKYKFGSVLLYRHDTWHRGTTIKHGCLRLVINCTFRKAGSEWISTLHQGWAWGMYRRSMQVERLIANLSIDQRCVLGFPGVGSSYWNKHTLEAVKRRYQPLGMDITPYVNGMNEPKNNGNEEHRKKEDREREMLDLSEESTTHSAHLDELYGVIETLEDEIKDLKQRLLEVGTDDHC